MDVKTSSQKSAVNCLFWEESAFWIPGPLGGGRKAKREMMCAQTEKEERRQIIDIYLQRLPALLLAQANWHLLTRRKRQGFLSLEMKK